MQAIYQNTIDYDDPPRLATLPDRTVLQDSTWYYATDLWNYASDTESQYWQLSYVISWVSDLRCGVRVDSHFINIVPQPGFVGSCVATAQANDGIKNGSSSFTVSVVPVRARIYLPIVIK